MEQQQHTMRKLRTIEMHRLSVEQFREARKLPLIVVLDDVRSLYNVGSVFRSCDAFRVEAVYLCGITATPPSRDIHKTALGAEMTVPWSYCASTVGCIAQLRAEGYAVYAVEQVEGAVMLDEFRAVPGVKYALVFGNEVDGVGEEAVDRCDGAVEIPQAGTKHSINVSVAGGVVLWAIFSQLRAGF